MKRQKGFLARRLAKGLAELRGDESQNQFARKVGLSNATMNRIENEVQNVSIATLEKLCIALRCDLTDLFLPEGKKRD